jgi:predicted transposase YdaD
MKRPSCFQLTDELFRATFSKLKNARAFFEAHLPSELVVEFDWENLTLVPGTFVPSDSDVPESDLLFSVTMDGKLIFLYLLFDHEGSTDGRLKLRLLSRIVSIWRDYDSKNPYPAELPMVFPVVLDQNRSCWKALMRS